MSLLTLLCLLLLAACDTNAQEAVTETPEAPAADQPVVPEAPAEEATGETQPVEEEPTVAIEEPTDPESEPEAKQEAFVEPADTEPADTEEADTEEAEEGSDDEGLVEDDGTDWAGLLERFPPFFALTHHAAVHLPIALWLLGAFFVVVGLFAPSWGTQIPLACLIGGALSSVAAAASGWWYAHYEYGEEWAWADGLGDFDTKIVQHRWTGVALVVASLVLSVIALISQKKQSKGLGFIWRVGLLVLAVAVGWEGHIGGELVMGEGFLEEAIEAWLTGE